MNKRMDEFHIGVQFSDPEIIEIGGPGSIVTQKYYTTTDSVENFVDDMEDDAENSPILYQWKENKINMYLSQTAKRNGICSFPHNPDHDEIIIIDNDRVDEPEVFLHEIGHFFNLRHTADGPPNAEGTLALDNKRWDQDELAMQNFGVAYASLSTSNRIKVDETFNNIMSQIRNQGENRTVLVDEQLDRWFQSVSQWLTRQDVMSGDAYYVNDNDNTSCNFSGSSPCGCDGTPYVPFEEVDCALDEINSSGGDIIVIKAGTYDISTNVISKSVLMTATRNGDAILK